jgi:flavin reductase (DIM6/NTAB) family NADH-FMN oxidoreductase RutF
MSAAAVDATTFRRLMARWPTGVAVLTARDGPVDHGMTVNALFSVSLTPPTILVSLGKEADSTPVVERTGAFAASFLAAGQRAISERFARTVPSSEKFRDLVVERSPSGLALIPGAVGQLECRVRSVSPALDHRLVLGELTWIGPCADALPLVFHRGGYAEAEREGRLRMPPGPPGADRQP